MVLLVCVGCLDVAFDVVWGCGEFWFGFCCQCLPGWVLGFELRVWLLFRFGILVVWVVMIVWFCVLCFLCLGLFDSDFAGFVLCGWLRFGFGFPGYSLFTLVALVLRLFCWRCFGSVVFPV